MTLRQRAQLLAGLSVLFATGAVQAGPGFTVVPFEFGPGKANLVSGQWIQGAGCPTLVEIQRFETTPPFDLVTDTLEDLACQPGDPKDKKNEALLLVKTGPTAQNASSGATLKGVKGITLTELGYDIRKPGGAAADPRGSHCGAGAPRFNIVAEGQLYFLGCNSPAPTVAASSDGWVRLRWSPVEAFDSSGLVNLTASGAKIDSISIVFDEGQDPTGGPDQFGIAVIDNIDVNGTLVGRGPAGGK